MTRLRNNEVVMGNGDARKSSPNVAHHYVLWVSISSRPTRDFHLCPTVSRLQICPIFHSLRLFALSINFNHHAPLNSYSPTLDRSVSLCHRFEIKKDVNFESRSLEEREEEEWRVLFPKRKEKNISNAAARKEASFSVIRMFRSQKSSQVFKSLTSCCP